MPQSSRIFLKNRALGYVSNHVPCITRYIPLRQENIIVTCVGKAFHSYSANHLSLLTVSDQTEESISCLVAQNKRIFTATGSVIQSWKRSSVIFRTYKGHISRIHLLLPLGPYIVSVDETNILKVWTISTQEVFLDLTFDLPTFRITAIVHPHTYVNKILLGSEQGRMQLWNLKTSKLVHTFDGWNSAITVLEQSTALDVVGVGLADGRIILHNLKYDKTIVHFSQDWGPVTDLSFRTDGPPIMVSGTLVGHVVIWDLEERRVASQILDAHDGLVSSVICLSGEPIMVTSSPDNSVKMWIFDQPDKGGRLLRKREGHEAQPSQVRFYPANENHILCSGGRTMRVFNVINESMNYSMGRASYNRKATKKKVPFSENLLMPKIVEFSLSTSRAKEWDNIGATHVGIPLVTTWSYEKRRLGEHKLLPSRWTNANRTTLNVHATSVHVTNCGNFIVIGYSSGHVDRFNIQSGLHRCTYGDPVAHKGQIRGVTVDPLNQFVITGCNEGLMKFWEFVPKKGTTRATRFIKIALGEPISFFRNHEESSLIVVILDDFSFVLVDIETKKVVRTFVGHTAQITDVTFSPDARWVITASVDTTIRTWDIPTCSLIDVFKVDSPCISLSMSPSGQYLATTHVGYIGIFLWSNKTLFSHVSLKPIKESDELPLLSLPHSTGVETAIELDNDEDVEEDEMETDNDMKSAEQIESLITLSGLSTSRWANLLDIDTIKARNKPKEPVTPQAAPFFLPTIPGLELKFDLNRDPTEEERLKTISLDALSSCTTFAQLLAESVKSNDYNLILMKLKSMGPSAVYTELNSFNFDMNNCEIRIEQFLILINYMFTSNKNFELAQSYLGLLMKIHGDTISQSTSLLGKLNEIEKVQQASWDKIQKDLQYCLCVIDSLKV
ncbi:hypothetical protein O3M35_008971 [Rhynocoris fuscipes]|uniref:WD repeat-containing protein 36 n=1 Tax=Rhynocoris fuscipes TaxID=488301 RepID=A0AAW1D3J4_9HEMI